MHRPTRGDNTKETFSPLRGLSYRYTPHHPAAKAAEKLCPDLEAFPLPLPPTHHPVHPSCPARPKCLAERRGEQAEVPAGRFCSDPPSCQPKWKARMLPKTASEKKGLTWAVVKATLELHRCSNSFLFGKYHLHSPRGGSWKKMPLLQLGRVWLGALAELIKAVEASASVGG